MLNLFGVIMVFVVLRVLQGRRGQGGRQLRQYERGVGPCGGSGRSSGRFVTLWTSECLNCSLIKSETEVGGNEVLKMGPSERALPSLPLAPAICTSGGIRNLQ